jgi:hypothetical protein
MSEAVWHIDHRSLLIATCTANSRGNSKAD